MGTFTTIAITIDAPIGIITLNRPERRNAISGTMLSELHQALDRLQQDSEVRVVVLKGEGKAFCAGFDLGEDYAGDRGIGEWREALSRDLGLLIRVWEFPKPIIAAVHGFALAGGLELAMACDITVSDTEARFGVPEIRFGSGFVALFLPWFAGFKKAKELMFTGEDRIPAQDALAMGLLNRVVAPDQLLPACLDLARTIASMDPAKIALLKQAINGTAGIMGMDAALRMALNYEIEIESLKTEDSLMFQDILRRDGVKAALKWRDSRFRAGSDDA